MLAEATIGEDERQDGERVLTVPFKPGESATQIRGAFSRSSQVLDAELHFAPWGSDDSGYAAYPTLNLSDGELDSVMERTKYARTWALVQEFRAGAENPMDYIRRVDTYLRGSAFQYTERPPSTPVDDAPLDYFINVSQLGYCQHFAGAMALMLRMAGIPARVATGFTPGGYSSRHKAWIVRDTDAHAWVEVWFDKYGWVDVDPTPSPTPARSQVAALAAAAQRPGDAGPRHRPGGRRRRTRTRSPCARSSSSAAATTSPAPSPASALGLAALGRGCRRWCWRLSWPWCCSSAARAARPRWTARSTRSRTRCAASAAR